MLFALALAVAATDGAAEAPSPRYHECIALVSADLEQGRKAAQRWAGEGGGADAQHCLAIADIAAGFPKLAAVRLQDIAQRKDAGDDFIRARLFAQASEAWLEAGEIDQAAHAIETAFGLAPDAGELYLTAAKIDGAKKDWQRAIRSVNAAEAANFRSVETYVVRARAYIALGDYESAAHDVVNALTIEPTNLDALVLRGEIQQAGVVIEVFYGDREADD